jgi:hypothetical protein
MSYFDAKVGSRVNPNGTATWGLVKNIGDQRIGDELRHKWVDADGVGHDLEYETSTTNYVWRNK